MREAVPQIEAAGAKVVAVSGKSPGMARTMQPQIPFPLLLDANHTLRHELGIDKLSVGQAMSVQSAINYAKALGGIRNFAVRASEATQTPVVVIFNADQSVAWQHVGEALGDYPSIGDVVAKIPAN